MHANRTGRDICALLEHAADEVDHVANLCGAGPVAWSEDWVKPEFVARREILEGHVCHLTIGNADHCSIEGSDSSRAQAYALDRSLDVAERDNVAEVHYPVEHQGEP